MKKHIKQHEVQATNFLVSINHQDNYSYQGFIQWLETGEKVHFRSELELIHLIHQAAQTSSGHQEFRTWGDKPQIHVV